MFSKEQIFDQQSFHQKNTLELFTIYQYLFTNIWC